MDSTAAAAADVEPENIMPQSINYVRRVVLAKKGNSNNNRWWTDGDDSKDKQSVGIRIKTLPTTGVANYIVEASNIADGLEYGDDIASGAYLEGQFTLGDNLLVVPAVNFNRDVSVLCDSDEVEFDRLVVNGITAYPTTGIRMDSTTAADVGIVPFSYSTATDPAGLSSYVRKVILADSSTGSSSQAEQTMFIRIKSLPSNAKYVVRKETSTGNWSYKTSSGWNPASSGGWHLDLNLGTLSIFVGDVTFDRNVEVLFNSNEIEFDGLVVNDVDKYHPDRGVNPP
jgi:hypothetical protein